MKRFIDNNQKIDNILAKYKRKCKCGHTKVVPPTNKYDYVICSWCGSRLYWDDEKQRSYDEKTAKNEFMYQLNKCIKEREEKELREKRRSTRLNRKNMKKRYFKSNTEYFKFCDRIDITIYIVDTTKADKIVVWYGAKLGRPKKNNSKPTPKEYRKRNNLKRLYHIF